MMLARTTTVSFKSSETQYKLTGRSRAGDGTSFSLPELKWLFDCGALVEGWKPKVVFLTHTHSDHVHFITHISDEKNPPMVYLPSEAEPFVSAHIRAYKEMIGCETQPEGQNGEASQQDCILRPTRPGEEISFRQGGTNFVVRTLKMSHRIPCLGYSIFKIQEKLKDEYKGVPGREIGLLRKSGVEITESKEVPFICFMGDTTSEVFRDHPEILDQHKVIVVECSFIDEDSIERAKITTHMHWNDLRPHVEANPEVLFLLTHFSLKYSSLKLREFFCKQQEQYDNIHPMLVDDEIEEIWSRKKNCSSEAKEMLPGCICRVCKDN
jgi:ribonuclease Z